MAVEFSELPSDESEPVSSPSKLVWSIIFVSLIAAGAAATVLLWPKNMPTNSWHFWTTIVVLPSALASFIVTRRFGAYEASKLDVQAKNEVVAAYNQSVFDAASNPFAVLAAAYRFSYDRKDNTLNSVLDKSMKLVSQVAIAQDAPPVRARWLLLPSVKLAAGPIASDKKRHIEAAKWLFGELVDELAETIKALPQRISLDIHFVMSSLLSIEERNRLWNDKWQGRGLRWADIAASDSDSDLMTLDRWLDRTIEAPENKARLIVAIQLNPVQSSSPSPGSAEAAVTLLLMPNVDATRHTLESTASLHRPVRAGFGQATETSQLALKWAGAVASDVKCAWQTGFDATQWGRICSEDALLGLTKNVIKMDQSIGYAGVAAPWLALACAAKSFSAAESKQMIFAGSENTFDCAVLIRSVLKNVPSSSTVHEATT